MTNRSTSHMATDPSSSTHLGIVEKTYCFFVAFLLIAYNIYIESGQPGLPGSAGFLLKVSCYQIVSIAFLISSVLIATRLINKLRTQSRQRPITFHACYVVFVVLVTVFQVEADNAKRYVQSFYYARSDAPCRKEIKQTTLGVAICYLFIDDPQAELIVVNPSGEIMLPKAQWRPETFNYFSNIDYDAMPFANGVTDCLPPRVYHLYGDVYYLSTRCA